MDDKDVSVDIVSFYNDVYSPLQWWGSIGQGFLP